jgi:hypothetical protein
MRRGIADAASENPEWTPPGRSIARGIRLSHLAAPIFLYYSKLVVYGKAACLGFLDNPLKSGNQLRVIECLR